MKLRLTTHVIASALLATGILASPGTAQSTVLASRTTTGTVGPQPSDTPDVSGDGRFTVFGTHNHLGLMPGAFGYPNVFLFDRTTGAVQAVTTSQSGQPGAGTNSEPVISDEGTWIAFASSHKYDVLTPRTSSNIWARATSNLGSTSPAYRRISISYTGTDPNQASYRPAISADGRHVVFESRATDLVPGLSTAWGFDVYVVDRDTDTNGVFDEPGATRTVLVSATPAGARGDGDSSRSTISGAGRYIVFQTLATDLVAGTSSYDRIILRDRDPDGNGIYDEGNATSSVVSVDPSGSPVTGGWSDISADGTTVAWQGPVGAAYVRDLTPRTTEIVSRNLFGSTVGGTQPRLSRDGQRVSFYTASSNLVWNNSEPWTHVYLHDRLTDQTTMLSTDSQGHPANSHSGLGSGGHRRNHALSADGKYAAFTSRGTNLFTPDHNNEYDIFVHRICENASTDLGYALTGTAGLYPAFTICGDFRSRTLLRLRNGLPSTGGIFILGAEPPLLAPVVGGTWVPQPHLVLPLATNAYGDVTLPARAVAGAFVLDAQFVFVDAGAPFGFSFSNALALRIP